MKRLYLHICCSLLMLVASVCLAPATPIHDIEGGDGTGCMRMHGHFSGDPASGCPVCFSGTSGVDRYYLGNTFSAFNIEKSYLGPEYSIQADILEEGREVSNPAPATLFLLGTGLIGLAAFRRKRPVRS